MSPRHTSGPRRVQGWSLVEMAIVLVVMGVLGVALWSFLPLAPKVAAGDVAARELAQAEQALLGHVLAHSRLPAPVLVDGLGMLPVEALGLPASLRVRYQVQPALTVSPGDSFSPMLPPTSGTIPAVNGLDFCMALMAARALTLNGMEGIPAAFALMHGGPAGHDRLAGAAFALPGSAALGERVVVAVGPGEFASRLGCPDRVAQAHGAARAAYTAHDLMRVAHEYDKVRTFAIQVAGMNLDNAETSEIFAGFDVAYGVFIGAMAAVQTAVGWPPDALGIVTGIVSHIVAVVQLALAIDSLVSAVQDRQDAEAALVVANNQSAAAQVNLTRMRALASASLLHAQDLDQEGLQP